MDDPRHIVYFDLETQKAADEVGGWDNKHLMRMSIGVTYDTQEGEYRAYEEDDAPRLIDRLKSADIVVGYNVINFDYGVLKGYTDFDFARVKTCDMMVELTKLLGFRPKLESVASATLNEGKSADGLAALRWFKEGEFAKIALYCKEDVRITKEVYEFGHKNKFVYITDRALGKRKVEVDW